MKLPIYRHNILKSRLYDTDVMNSYSADAYAELFEADISRVLNVCVPLRTDEKREGTHDHGSLSVEASTAKRTCRRLERRFRPTEAPPGKQKFVQARSVALDLIIKPRAAALVVKVNESTGDPKKPWNTTKQLLHNMPSSTVSDDECVVMVSAICQL